MPLPSDEKILALSQEIIQTFDSIFGLHPGFRPVHAKGILLAGTFTPAPGGAELSRAAHFSRPSTPVFVRFSDSTGLPAIPDNDANADPRGCAVRFQLAEHVHTDIVAHSANGFPARTGQEFLELLRAIATSDPANLAGSPLEKFLGTHPEALAYVQLPKPAPVSFARESYFGLNAMRFTNNKGVSCYGRYRIVLEAGEAFVEDAARPGKATDYLFEEIKERIGKRPVRLQLRVQLAQGEDVVDDVTVHWPDERPVVALGTLELTSIVPENAHEQKVIIFDPIPRLDGIEPSADPLLELRAAVYLISGRRRRAAPDA